jgi:hypothetical protein
VHLEPFVDRLNAAISQARTTGELSRDAAAGSLWGRIYGRLSAGRPGMLGAMTARAEAQVMRLACLYTVMEVSGHSSTRMLARYTHPTTERKIAALESFAPAMGRTWAERETEGWKKVGGPHEARTRDLRVANAALSQLS